MFVRFVFLGHIRIGLPGPHIVRILGSRQIGLDGQIGVGDDPEFLGVFFAVDGQRDSVIA